MTATNQEWLAENTRAAQAKFIAAFAACASIKGAADAAGIDRTSHYNWLEDPDYAARFAVAKEDAIEALETEARRRAIEGVERVKIFFYQGKECGRHVDREYSDGLLMFLLKAHRPEMYRDRVEQTITGSLGLNHAGSVNVTMQEILDELDRREIERIGAPEDPGA